MLGRSAHGEGEAQTERNAWRKPKSLSRSPACALSLAHGDDWATAAVALLRVPRSPSGPSRSSSGPLRATSRYAHSFPAVRNRAPKPYVSYLYSDLIKLKLYACIVLNNFDPIRPCVQLNPVPLKFARAPTGSCVLRIMPASDDSSA